MHLKWSSVKWRPFCPGGDELARATCRVKQRHRGIKMERDVNTAAVDALESYISISSTSMALFGIRGLSPLWEGLCPLAPSKCLKVIENADVFYFFSQYKFRTSRVKVLSRWSRGIQIIQCPHPPALCGQRMASYMMTPLHVNVFLITGPLWEESTRHRRIPPHKGLVIRSFEITFVISLNKLLSQPSSRRWFWMSWRPWPLTPMKG